MISHKPAVEFKYCPQCQSVLDLSGEHPKCRACGVTFYRNSKPAVGILPIKNGEVLLSRRKKEPYKGELDIIGGFLNYGEHPEVGVVREFEEETGAEITITKFMGIYMDEYGAGGDSTLNIHYLGEVGAGELKANDDIESLHWIPIMEVPTNEGAQNYRRVIKDLQKWFSSQK
jgi:ADP-ribose pyrophosphatase YjhB (NUDIX family)